MRQVVVVKTSFASGTTYRCTSRSLLDWNYKSVVKFQPEGKKSWWLGEVERHEQKAIYSFQVSREGLYRPVR